MYPRVATIVPLSLHKVPHNLQEQSTTPLLETVLDIMKREKQLLCIVCESITKYNTVRIIEFERHEALRSALLSLCVPLRP